jgi:hypothetical protein
MLTGRILFTLGKEYDGFKDVCDTIPMSKQTVNLLIEKLCAIEWQPENWHRLKLQCLLHMQMTRSRIL